jgi:hypothetical protein
MITGSPKYIPEVLLGQTLGKYHVREIIGRGGMGVVFKVWDTLEDRAKAIKMVPPELTSSPLAFEDLKREISMAAAIIHPNVVKVLSLEAQDGQYFIVMEYIEGESLEAKIARAGNRRLNEPDVIRIMKKAASGLIEAHNGDIIHRDLKPRNIMEAGDGQVKILDFGVSHRMTRSMTELTGWDSTGTWPYMAPEQLSNNFGRENQQVDIWAFGVTMYQLLSGEVPFRDRQQIVDLKEKPFPLEGVSRKTSRIVMKCLEKDRKKRYQHMSDVLKDLEAIRTANERTGVEASGKDGGWKSFLEWPRIAAALLLAAAFLFLYISLALNRDYHLDQPVMLDKTASRLQYEAYLEQAKKAAAGDDYKTALDNLDRAGKIFAAPRLEHYARDFFAQLSGAGSGRLREFLDGPAARDEKIEKCREFLEKYRRIPPGSAPGAVEQVAQIRRILGQLLARTVAIDDLAPGIAARYHEKLRRVEIPGLPEGIQVLGRIRFRLRVTDKGQIDILYFDDTGLNLTDQKRLQTVNQMIIKKLSAVTLAPPRDKSGAAARVENWEINFKVGTFQRKIILLRED